MESDEERDERVERGLRGGWVGLVEEGAERGKRENGKWLDSLDVISNRAAGSVDKGRS